MNKNQAAAYVMAQAALLNAEIAGMQAENEFRTQIGKTIAYGDESFTDLRLRYKPVIGHNAVLDLYEVCDDN